MSICKIGETKVINGKRCRKAEPVIYGKCQGCCFYKGKNGGCPTKGKAGSSPANVARSIESGGCECRNSIWILADDQPEAPTATPPRDEGREQRRFTAAVAAMQGLLATTDAVDTTPEGTASWSVRYSDALLAELDRTGAGK